MKKYSKIIERLREDELKNINLLNFTENKSVLDIKTKGKSGGKWSDMDSY